MGLHPASGPASITLNSVDRGKIVRSLIGTETIPLGNQACPMVRKPLDSHPGRKSLKVRAARLYSDLLSPPSAFAIFAFILAWSELPFWKGSLHAAIFGILTSLMPLIYILVLLKRGRLSDIHISSPAERRIPYILGILGAILAYFALRALGSSELFLDYILANIVGLGSLAIINARWLISAHTASITTLTFFAGYAYNLTIALMLSPLILITIFVRHYLQRHNITELIAGVLVGMMVIWALASLGIL